MYIRRESLVNEFRKWLHLVGEYESDIPPVENIAVSALMTIEEAPSVNVVSEEVYEQVRWERDIAIKQLESIGLHFGEKTDDVVKVVRCEHCANSDYEGRDLICYMQTDYMQDEIKFCVVAPDHFCSYGEPR